MLTIKQIENDGVEHIWEAEHVIYEAKNPGPHKVHGKSVEGLKASMVLAFGVPGSIVSPMSIADGTVYVMNDKGRTIASYYLDLDNAVAGISGVAILETALTDNQIAHLRDRFLGWKLPPDFHPDCGIHFDADAAKRLNPANHRYEPTGTNLFDATQADAMVRYMLDGMPHADRSGGVALP